MKQIKYIFFLIASVTLVFGSCTEPDNYTDGAVEGGLLEITTPAINYVVGENRDYTVEFKVFQSANVKTTQVEVYVQFAGKKQNADGTIFLDEDESPVTLYSNEKLLTTITVNETTTHYETFTVNLAQLTDGMSVTGNDRYTNLPIDDTQYAIGDSWRFRFVSTTTEGKQHENSRGASVDVSTRFAGTYVVKELSYYRLGVQSPSYWLGEEVVIKSIDAITYFYDWGASIGWTGPLYFQIDPGTLEISYPAEWDGVAQVLNGQPLTTPTANPNDLTNVIPLTTTPNLAIKDDVEGKDMLILVYGYYTGGSGPREFYEVLEKVK